MRLISQGNQHYVSEDGRVEVILDSTFVTECDEPHPVKMRMDVLRAGYSQDAAGQRGFDKMVSNIKLYGGREFTKKTKEGWVTYLSWMCEGGEEHNYSMWTSQVDGEWTDIVTDKFSETLGELEKLLGEEIKVSHPRKPKPKLSDPRDDDDRRTAELRDELGAVESALDRYEELMASDHAPFVDQGLHDYHLKRKGELETMILERL